ncbi:MAG: cyclic pyranopterin monophosphate synthase MoaC [Candidatus Omnitrophica bacterium]|nr:cyclic pyranopterin monophosphate synthase MoaC [Candidatus Omnitrophota bacterium]
MAKKIQTQSQGMVDISGKAVTARIAIASGSITMSAKAFKILKTTGSPKGDVFATAKVAAVMAAKSTPAIIPFCHPLMLNKVNIIFESLPKISMITVMAQVKSDGKTGVEMEALTAVSAACLTVYDMMKWADPAMVISDIKLLEKRGGKSGDYQRG